MRVDNLQVYNRAEVAAHYAVLDYLTPCEQLLFDQYIKPNAAIVDLGFGVGLTTPYLLDSVDGGLLTHCWVPTKVVSELQKQQFRLLKVLGDDYPHVSQEYVTDWYYYVFLRSNPVANGGTCA